MQADTGTLFTVSAPSGAGKTSLIEALLPRCKNTRVSVSHTTRPMRPSEQDGCSYHFVSTAAFQEMLSQDAFLEHAQVFDNCYGTARKWVQSQLALGLDVILEIDWQGASQVKRQLPDSIAIFILPPSRDALKQRLAGRGQDNAEIIARRTNQAAEEISHYPEADFIVVNDRFERAVEELRAIVVSQALRRVANDGSERTAEELQAIVVSRALRRATQVQHHRGLLAELLL